MTQPDRPDNLELELYAGLRVVQSQQSEINRRIGNIEKTLEERIVDPARVAELEGWREESSYARRDWLTWGLQILGSAALLTLLSWLSGQLGVDLKW